MFDVKCIHCKQLDAAPGGHSCHRCWELMRRIESDMDLAKKFYDAERSRRLSNSPLGSLRDDIIGFVGKTQAEECAEDGEQALSWSDVLVDGVVGLVDMDDQDLLEELWRIMECGDPPEKGLALVERLKDDPTWIRFTEEKNG